jgi:hypothetical protein
MTSSTQNVHLDGHGGLDITASVTVPHGPAVVFTPTAAPSLCQSGGDDGYPIHPAARTWQRARVLASVSSVGAAAWTKAVDHGFIIILDLAIDGQTTSGGTTSVRDLAVYER